MHKRIVIVSAVVAAMFAVGGLGVVSAAGQEGGHEPITLCHARASVTNPYGPKAITVDADAIFDDPNVVPNGHGTHTGPLFPADDWGDIIPPFDGFPGLNWPAGQAILENDCQIPGPPETTPETLPPGTPPGGAPGLPELPGASATQGGGAPGQVETAGPPGSVLVPVPAPAVVAVPRTTG